MGGSNGRVRGIGLFCVSERAEFGLHRVNADALAKHFVNLLVDPAFEFFETSDRSWTSEDLIAECAELVFLQAE